MKKIPFFTKEVLDVTSCGAILRQRRIELGRTLEQASEALRIGKNYLDALENEAYSSIPGLLYAKRFLKAYTGWLGVSGAYPLFEARLAEKPREDRLLTQRVSSRDLMVFPRMIRYGIALCGCFIFVGYLLFGVYSFLQPPELTLSPQVPITHKKEIVISGNAANTQKLFVNGEEVPVVDGRFETTTVLVSGLNSISFRAFNRVEKQSDATVSVYYEKVNSRSQVSLR